MKKLLFRIDFYLDRNNTNGEVFILHQAHEDESGLTQLITLTGNISNDIVRNYYPMFDAFAHACYNETFEVVYIEAMYAGLPTIGIKGQGIDGVIVHGENRLLAKPKDSDDLASKIEYLVIHTEDAKELARCGGELIKSKFMLSQIIQDIASKYVQ